MNQFYPTLQKCALFKDIDTSELKSMLNCLEARTVSYSRNEIIFCEGDPARYVGIVLSGKVQIIKEDFFGNSAQCQGMITAWKPAEKIKVDLQEFSVGTGKIFVKKNIRDHGGVPGVIC